MKTKILFTTVLLMFMAIAVEAQTDSTSYAAKGILKEVMLPVLRIRLDAGVTPPTVGQKGELQKFIKSEKPGFSFTSWLVIAWAQVTQVEGNLVVLKVLEERSVMTINGEKKNHFTPESEVKFTWKKAGGTGATDPGSK